MGRCPGLGQREVVWGLEQEGCGGQGAFPSRGLSCSGQSHATSPPHQGMPITCTLSLHTHCLMSPFVPQLLLLPTRWSEKFKAAQAAAEAAAAAAAAQHQKEVAELQQAAADARVGPGMRGVDYEAAWGVGGRGEGGRQQSEVWAR
jgi:pyruvate/2-oxoglutarate dehydrogenase complex dihydrolipoamide acyltransferase (E2) component